MTLDSRDRRGLGPPSDLRGEGDRADDDDGRRRGETYSALDAASHAARISGDGPRARGGASSTRVGGSIGFPADLLLGVDGVDCRGEEVVD